MIFCTDFFKESLKETQAFHTLPLEQGTSALWLQTQCPRHGAQSSRPRATAVGEGAEPPWFFLQNKVTAHKARGFSAENRALSWKNFLRPPKLPETGHCPHTQGGGSGPPAPKGWLWALPHHLNFRRVRCRPSDGLNCPNVASHGIQSFCLFFSRKHVLFVFLLAKPYDVWDFTSPVCINCLVVSDSLRPQGLEPARLLCPWDSPGKNTGVGCHPLLQGVFLTQVLNTGLLLCRQTLYRLSHQGEAPYFPNQGSNPCPCSRSSEPYPPDHQGSPQPHFGSPLP